MSRRLEWMVERAADGDFTRTRSALLRRLLEVSVLPDGRTIVRYRHAERTEAGPPRSVRYQLAYAERFGVIPGGGSA